LSLKKKSKFLEKKAIQNHITSIVNTTVFDLQTELPAKWVKKMHIKWRTGGSLKRLKSGESIMVIQPSDKQDYNVINGVYFYFHYSLFPNTYEVVPKRVLNALSIRLSHRTLSTNPNSKVLLPQFERTIMEREVDLDMKILEFLDPFTTLDNYGFLTGALVRETDAVAEKNRFKKERLVFEDELKKILDHMLEFITKLPTGNIPEHKWYYENSSHTFEFLLARNPKRMKVDRYLARAQSSFDKGVDRLYVFGSNADIEFTNKLIRRINSDTDFKLKENFNLARDYRSNKKGIGTLFIK